MLKIKNSNLSYLIKWKYLLIILLYFIFRIKTVKFVKLKNGNKISDYEKDINFSNMKTDIKAIALYLPQFHSIEVNDKIWGKGFTEWTNVKKCLPSYKGHHQPRIPGDIYGYLGYYDLTNMNSIKTQVNLAKRHGIYGFAIYYYWFSGKQLLEKPLNLFLKSKINFHFLLIWANENWTKKWNGLNKEVFVRQKYKKNDPINFIKDIKKYVMDKRYIRIDNKPILGLYEPKKVPNLRKTIRIWRQKSRQYGIGEIFILISINSYKIQDFQKLRLFDAAYEFPPRNSFRNHRIRNKRTFIYSELLYKSRDLKVSDANPQKLLFFRGSMLEWDNCPRIKSCAIFDHFSPEQFYMYNKIIVEWTKKHYNHNLRFIFINAWNEWGEGSYLEPDDLYGYASINALSKAIFNISYVQINNLKNLIGKSLIAVFAHVNNEKLMTDIVDKTNNIPFNYDLFISLNNNLNINKTKQYIKINTKANNLDFEISFNSKKNLNIFSFDLPNQIKKYKYLCNINTNINTNINYYEELNNYILNNLLGNSLIISEILTDFENNAKLGIIFPERYYKSLYQFGESNNYKNLKYINMILKRINSEINVVSDIIDYPEENMFWARAKIIYPLFNIDSKILSDINFQLMLDNNLEKMWIYIIKFNGYFYRKIFKHL